MQCIVRVVRFFVPCDPPPTDLAVACPFGICFLHRASLWHTGYERIDAPLYSGRLEGSRFAVCDLGSTISLVVHLGSTISPVVHLGWKIDLDGLDSTISHVVRLDSWIVL